MKSISKIFWATATVFFLSVSIVHAQCPQGLNSPSPVYALNQTDLKGDGVMDLLLGTSWLQCGKINPQYGLTIQYRLGASGSTYGSENIATVPLYDSTAGNLVSSFAFLTNLNYVDFYQVSLDQFGVDLNIYRGAPYTDPNNYLNSQFYLPGNLAGGGIPQIRILSQPLNCVPYNSPTLTGTKGACPLKGEVSPTSTWWTNMNVGGDPYKIISTKAVDLDGDGIPDFVAEIQYTVTNQIYIVGILSSSANNINSVSPQSVILSNFVLPANTTPGALIIADVNGDGLKDLIVPLTSTAGISFEVATQTQTGVFSSPAPATSVPVLIGSNYAMATLNLASAMIQGTNPSMSSYCVRGAVDFTKINTDADLYAVLTDSTRSGPFHCFTGSTANKNVACVNGDLDGDGYAGSAVDLAIAKANCGWNGTTCTNAMKIPAGTSGYLYGDINGDGVVSNQDIALLQSLTNNTQGKKFGSCSIGMSPSTSAAVLSMSDISGAFFSNPSAIQFGTRMTASNDNAIVGANYSKTSTFHNTPAVFPLNFNFSQNLQGSWIPSSSSGLPNPNDSNLSSYVYGHGLGITKTPVDGLYYAAVGSYSENDGVDPLSSHVDIYKSIDGVSWNHFQTILPSNPIAPATDSVGFGYILAIQDDTLVIGSMKAVEAVVYKYNWPNTSQKTWQPVQTLTPLTQSANICDPGYSPPPAGTCTASSHCECPITKTQTFITNSVSIHNTAAGKSVLVASENPDMAMTYVWNSSQGLFVVDHLFNSPLDSVISGGSCNTQSCTVDTCIGGGCNSTYGFYNATLVDNAVIKVGGPYMGSDAAVKVFEKTASGSWNSALPLQGLPTSSTDPTLLKDSLLGQGMDASGYAAAVGAPKFNTNGQVFGFQDMILSGSKAWSVTATSAPNPGDLSSSYSLNFGQSVAQSGITTGFIGIATSATTTGSGITRPVAAEAAAQGSQ